MTRLERLYAVAEEIRRRSPATVSAADLAQRFGVSRRTMERDLAALREAGLPLYALPGRTGGYAVADAGGRLVFTLSAAEVTGLLMAVAASEPAPYADAARVAAQRLLDALPAPTRVAVEELRARIRASVPGAPTVDPGVRRTLEEAVRTGRVVNLVYADSEGTVTERAVEAVGFYGGSGGWFLFGWCRLRQDRRIFRLDRIERATLTREPCPQRDIDATLGWVPEEVAAP